MRQKFSWFLSIAGIAILTISAFQSCKKQSDVIVPPAAAHFMNKTSGSYYVQNDPSSVFNVTVGSTTVSKTDRTVNYTVSSPTGAAVGAQYSIANSGTVVIPAGQATANIPVKGVFAGFPGNRKDTLIFTITGGDLQAAPYNSTFKLVLNKYCNVDLTALAGTYVNTFDKQAGSPDYGPYTTVFGPSTSTGATTGTMKIANFWDVGGSITVNLDWTDPANFKTTVPTQFLYTDPTYGAATIKPVGNGTFSSCDQTFSFSYTVTVAAGSFGNFTTTMKR